MILVDSSVWIDHLRSANRVLVTHLDSGRVLGHLLITGELALGSLRARAQTLALMKRLPQAPVATPDEVMYMIEEHRLYGRGIGWVDAHLLASVRLVGDAQLWTRDKRLHAIARELGIAMSEVEH